MKKISMKALLMTLLVFGKAFSMDYATTLGNALYSKPALKVGLTTFGLLTACKVLPFIPVYLKPTLFPNAKNFSEAFPKLLKKTLKTTLKYTVPVAVSMTVVARCGSWPQKELGDLIKPMGVALGVTSLLSLGVGGCIALGAHIDNKNSQNALKLSPFREAAPYSLYAMNALAPFSMVGVMIWCLKNRYLES